MLFSLSGLLLVSLVFLERDSDLELPRTILEIFWTVLSVIDSVLDSLGDFTLDFVSSSLHELVLVALLLLTLAELPARTEVDIFVSLARGWSGLDDLD